MKGIGRSSSNVPPNLKLSRCYARLSATRSMYALLCSQLVVCWRVVHYLTKYSPSAAKSVWELQYKDAGQASHSPMFEPPTPPAIPTRTVKKPQQYARSERNARPMDEGTDVHAQLARRSTRRSRVDAPIQEPKPSTLVPQPNDDELCVLLYHLALRSLMSIQNPRAPRWCRHWLHPHHSRRSTATRARRVPQRHAHRAWFEVRTYPSCY
jgi:hypothetical protein